ncbi:hypothetical protein QBC39DRAFT_6627 [Podospora conica]|nr:hypothetical protein QBC39DRAFT_6627 [Schizothecium conicum]
MPVPVPDIVLKDICSVIHDNTLYTYSANAFQALPLKAGTKWKQLPRGEQVTGGVCVDSPAALFIVGGKGTTQGYHGLQKFTYATGKWESITLPQPVTQERVWHGATYISATDSILMYAGSQDGSRNPSSQTFTIGANAPHTVLAFESAAPPAINPILLPWSASEAVLVGGNTWSKNVMLFSTETKWRESGASLSEPFMKDTSAVKAIVMTGDDGSKSLYTFDMSVSPNLVQRTLLFSGPGVPIPNSPPVRRAFDGENIDRRQDVAAVTPLTAGAWPAYNSTLAPKATRNAFALAADANGLVVAAGGNEEDVLCMFDARQNRWQNATALLDEPRLFLASSSSTLSSSLATSATSTGVSSTGAVAATATSTESPVPATGGLSSTNSVLAAVLGSIFGLAIILFGLYYCLQRKKKKRAHMEAGHTRRASGLSSNEKSGIGYASDTLPPGPSGAVFRGHQTQDSQSSFSSMAILMGRMNQQKPGQIPSRNSSQNTRRSSTDSTFKAFKSTISKPIPQASAPTVTPRSPQPGPQSQMEFRDEKGVSFPTPPAAQRPRRPSAADSGSLRRSSGWNRYWSGGSALGLLGFGNSSNTPNPQPPANPVSKRTTVASETSSQYSNTQHRITQDSATVPPLHIYEPRASFSRVASRSPTIAQYNEKLKEAVLGKIEDSGRRPPSAVSDMSAYSSGIPASVHEAWDPTEGRPWGYDRSGQGQGQGRTFYHEGSSGSFATPLAPPGAGGSSTLGVPKQQFGRSREQREEKRDDMSWLNLGGGGGGR